MAPFFILTSKKKGEQHVLSIRLDVANERFLSEQVPLFTEAIKLVAEVLLKPYITEGSFATSIVSNEKRSLKQRIQSVYDDKMRYANVRVTEEMCKGEPYGLTAFGTEADIEAIDSGDLYEYYQEMLRTNQVDIYLVGAMDEGEVVASVKRMFDLPARMTAAATPTKNTAPQKIEEKTVQEEQDVKQGKLNIGYRTHTTYADPDYVAMQVCNGLFGGYSHSKLFINVREKESLAYYAASRYESHKGILMVVAGIEFSKYERAVTIIKEQMEAMKQGEFTEAELEQTKAMLKNQLLETSDVASGYVELTYHQAVSGYSRSLEEWLAEIDKVTKEEVVAAASKIELDTIYFLKGKEEAK